MSNDQTTNTQPTNDDTQEQSLEDFATELFSGSDDAPDPAKSEETDDDNDPGVSGESDTTDTDDSVDTQTDVTEDGDVSEDDDTLAQDDDDNEPDADDVDQKPKKKNRFQERIDELTAARKEAERKVDEQAADFQKQLDEMRNKLEGNKDDEPKDKSEGVGSELKAPQKDDLTEDGKPKYPLGEYDPQFMRDTVEHMFAEREQEQEQKQQVTAEEREQQAAKAELQGQWNDKLDDARERYPDFQQKGEQMLTVFEGIDEQYGEYLTTTLMEMDNGPDVFYYLANNVEEAQAIVSRGAKKATMELAKLEMQLGGQKPGQPKQKVTKAKTPPPQNKGSSVIKPKTPVDTDDLDAFSRDLFQKQ